MKYEVQVVDRFSLQVDDLGRITVDGVKFEPDIRGNITVPRLNNNQPFKAGSLVAFVTHSCKLPIAYIDRIVPLFKDGNDKNLAPKNVEYRYDGLIEHPDHPGMFYIPYFNEYLINAQAEVYSIRKDRNLSVYVSRETDNARNGYKTVVAKPDNPNMYLSNYTTVGVHRFLGFTFLKYEADVHSKVINHLDGDGGNNVPNNIEWTTRAGNLKHAYETGLNGCGSKAVLAKNLKTGEVTRYNSLQAVMRVLGYQDIAGIQRRLYKGFGKVYSDFIGLKLDDGSPWPEYNLAGPIATRHNASKIVCKNVFDNKICIVQNYRQAAELTGVNAMSVFRAVETSRDLPIKGWMFRDKEKFKVSNLPTFSELQLEFFRRHFDQLPPVALTAEKDGIVVLVDNLTGISLLVNGTCQEVANAVKTGIELNGYRIQKWYSNRNHQNH